MVQKGKLGRADETERERKKLVWGRRKEGKGKDLGTANLGSEPPHLAEGGEPC